MTSKIPFIQTNPVTSIIDFSFPLSQSQRVSFKLGFCVKAINNLSLMEEKHNLLKVLDSQSHEQKVRFFLTFISLNLISYIDIIPISLLNSLNAMYF